MGGQINFSPAQLDAIVSRGENLLVSAGAGSGKTTVLVERILRYIADGGKIAEILALTFTNDAAADMREKLDRAISALVAAQPDNRHLQEQLVLLPQAQISTIHSFCLELLRQNYYRLDLEAGFRVAGEAEIKLLEREILLQYLEEAYADPASGICALADAYGGNRDDSALVEIMLELHNFCRSRPQPLAWLADACAVFSSRELAGYPFAADITVRLQRSLNSALQAYQRLLQQAEQLDDRWVKVLQEDQQQLAAAQELNDPATLLRALAQLSFGRLPALRSADPQLREQIKGERDRIKEQIRKLKEKYTAVPLAQQLEELHQLEPLMAALYRLMEGFEQALTAEKRRRGWVDFSDMEHLTLELLEDRQLRSELAQQYREILVDEYQDINELQEAIIRRVCSRDNLFAVGDVKQSIYRFRLAEPQLFLTKYNNYGSAQGGRRIDLNYNYRSETAVIDGVNFIFRQLMRGDIAEIDYDEDAQLHTEKTAPSAAPEFWLLDLEAEADGADDDDEPVDQEAEALSQITYEARLIGQRIRELADQGYEYRDMAVLLRVARGREPVVMAELTRQGIPALSGGEQGYLEAPEISLMLSALRVIDNPHQDIPLAAVLRSPLTDFTPEELVEIRLAAGEGDLYAAIQAAAADSQRPWGSKCAAFLQTLDRWRQLAGGHSVSSLIAALYRENGYYQLVGAMSGGALRQANLQLLLQEARAYEQHNYAGLFRFINYLSQVEERQLRCAAARLSGRGDNAVRVMSIHRSKGLEFPVVFIAGLGGRFNFLEERRDIIWERDAGLGARIADRSQRRKYPSLAHTAVADRLRELSLAEEIRIYYVAFTRARERLILCAAQKDLAKQMRKWTRGWEGGRLNPQYILSAQHPLAWLGAALLRHPDAAAWRELAEADPQEQLPAAAHWQLHYLPVSQLTDAGTRPHDCRSYQPAQLVSPDVVAALSWSYPYAGIAGAPGKWTVTELSRLGAADDFAHTAAYAAEAPTAPAVDHARRGTAYHRLLEHLDLAAAPDEVARQISELVEDGQLASEDAVLIDPLRIVRFLESPLGVRLRAAKRVLREQQFTFLTDGPQGEQIMVQGMLDLAFWEEDGWVLVDYKTGGYGRSEQQIRETYAPQLAYYRQAMERLVGGSVRESWLVMLDLEQLIAL